MKKYILCLLSTTMGLGLYGVSSNGVQAAQQPATLQNVAYAAKTGGTVVYQGGIRLRYYPNRLVTSDYYNREVLEQILALSRNLGWDTVYVQDLPEGLRTYARQYFSDNDIDLNYLSDDAVVTGPQYVVPSEDDDTDGLYYNAIPYEPDVFYGYGGNGYYGGYYGNGYYGNGYYRRHHGDHGWNNNFNRGGWVGGNNGRHGGGAWVGGGGHRHGGGGGGGGHGGRR